MSKKYLLIHGAWQGAWVWQPVINDLVESGSAMKAIDLPGSGDDQTPASAVSLDSYADRVVDEARKFSTQGDIV